MAGFLTRFVLLFTFQILALSLLSNGQVHRNGGLHRHARQLPHAPLHLAHQRNVAKLPSSAQFTNKSATTYAMITTFPGAPPVAITSQSQVITSFMPQYTLCELSPTVKTTSVNSTTRALPPYRNISRTAVPIEPTTTDFNGLMKRRLVAEEDHCYATYHPVVTTVCSTTLTALASQITVTSCSQEITFSSQYGYVMSIPPGDWSTAQFTPAVQTLTTYYEAPWQSLTDGLTPQEVTLKICSQPSETTSVDQCVDVYQTWQTTLVSYTTTSTSYIDFTTTIYGPSRIYVETFHADITEMETEFSLSTRLVLAYSTESISTMTTSYDDGLAGLQPSTTIDPSEFETTTSTVQVIRVSPTTQDITTTIHIRSTTTLTDTTTSTLPIAAETSSVDAGGHEVTSTTVVFKTVTLPMPQ